MSDIVAANQLKLLIDRIRNIREEIKGLKQDEADVFGEAKATGFEPKTIRKIIELLEMEKHHRDEAEMLLETYKAAVGLA